jgi:uncharacterized membrane protein YbhN (UPF0104 family)
MRTSAARPEESAPASPPTRTRWHRARPFVLLALGGVALYVLLPSLLAVFGSWRSLSHLDWPFAVLVLVCEVASFVCLWELDRIALRTRAWLPVIAAQLSGNAAGRVFPGGGATARVVSASMLRQAGIDTGEAAAAFGRPARDRRWCTDQPQPRDRAWGADTRSSGRVELVLVDEAAE